MDLGRDNHRKQAILERVASEDIGERRADHGAESILREGPGRVLARTAAAEIIAGNQNFRTLGLGFVQWEIGLGSSVGLVAPVAEQSLAHALFGDGLQITGRDDLIGIDIIGRDHDRFALDGLEFHSRVLTSVTTPVTADAAAVSGLARNVRPPLPWRPSKFRLLVETLYSPGSNWSPFIARHIEQPASRKSAPASRKILSSPSASACFLTCCDPGTTSMRTLGFTFRPLITRAAARRSEMRELVQLPTKTTSMGWPSKGLPGSRSMYRSAFTKSDLAIGSGIEAGSGIAPEIGMPMPGLVPKVTMGSSSLAS